MDRSLLCGCKGIRTCFICEKEFNLTPTVNSSTLKVSNYTNLKYFDLFGCLVFRNYPVLHIVLIVIYYGVVGMLMSIKTILIILVNHIVLMVYLLNMNLLPKKKKLS